MGSIISLTVIYTIKSLFKLHQQINGKWINYFYFRIKLFLQRKSRILSIQKHDPYSNDATKSGFLSSKEEWRIERPSNVNLIIL
jgi:hypothetical protein